MPALRRLTGLLLCALLAGCAEVEEAPVMGSLRVGNVLGDEAGDNANQGDFAKATTPSMSK